MFKVNLIPYNPTGMYDGSSRDAIGAVQARARQGAPAVDGAPDARPRHRRRLRAARRDRVTRVVFETHSTSVDNERGIATGWLPGELSDAGRTQAAELGERRRDDGIDLVVCSDLRRAVETVEIAFAGSPLPIRYDARLRECNYGDWNGMPRARLEAERVARIDVPFPGGESWREAVSGTQASSASSRRERDHRRVLLVGHVATRWALDHLLGGVPLEQLAAETFLWQEGWEYVLAENADASA